MLSLSSVNVGGSNPANACTLFRKSCTYMYSLPVKIPEAEKDPIFERKWLMKNVKIIAEEQNKGTKELYQVSISLVEFDKGKLIVCLGWSFRLTLL